jgi:hypothetical protein
MVKLTKRPGRFKPFPDLARSSADGPGAVLFSPCGQARAGKLPAPV